MYSKSPMQVKSSFHRPSIFLRSLLSISSIVISVQINCSVVIDQSRIYHSFNLYDFILVRLCWKISSYWNTLESRLVVALPREAIIHHMCAECTEFHSYWNVNYFVFVSLMLNYITILNGDKTIYGLRWQYIHGLFSYVSTKI
jgi:hypothetical protein